MLAKGTRVADTSELFLRSIQLYQMFAPAPRGSGYTAASPQTARPAAATASAASRTGAKAIDKIPKWAGSPDQNNYKILRAYLQLLDETGRVNRPALEARCQSAQAHPDVYVRDFRGNFASMKTDKGNSHGKVFEDDGYNITVWSAVADTLEKHKSLFLT